MSRKYLRIFLSLVIVFSMVSISETGQAAKTPDISAQWPDFIGQNGPPPGFDPRELKLSDRQPTILGEVGSGREDRAAYIIILAEPAVPSYTGGIPGLRATSPTITAAQKLEIDAQAVQAYAGYLKAQHARLLSAFQSEMGYPLRPGREYVYALNGIAARLTREEVEKISSFPDVKEIQPDVAYGLITDTSPEWVGATAIWDGSATGGIETKGEGIIIGIIDSGINMDHPSFAAVGGDGYAHENPLGSGNNLGWCDPGHPNYDTTYVCNDKLIGAWDYADASWSGEGAEEDGPYDNESHGSHVASIAAGNFIDQATLYAPTVRFADSISGIAPHASIVAYDVCGATGSCYSSDVIAAVDQAIVDGVDVINESIGIGGDSLTGAKQMAYLNAVAAGIFYARATGNEGPGAATVGPEPPWVFSTAALTHNRKMLNRLTNLAGGQNPPGAMDGLGFTASYGPAEIVYSAHFTETLKPGATLENARLCAMGNPDDDAFESPWEDGTFSGEIVVCDRGEYPRIEKGSNVKTSGAGGFVLADDGNGVVSDAHVLPGVHISYQNGILLKAWLDPEVTQTATIAGYGMDFDLAYADIMANFSSRGPVDIDIIKPDGGAPGAGIWAAWSDRPGEPDDGEEYGFKDGTSMASPQAAGMAALLKSVHPDWTPAEIKSALMTTATTENTVESGTSQIPTDPFDVGSGRIRADQAAQAGLLFGASSVDFASATDDTVRNLNLPSFANGGCFLSCSWTRTATNPLSVSVNWSAVLDAPAGTQMTISPNSFLLPPEGAVDFTLTITMTTANMEEWLFGSVTFSPNVSGIPDAYLPLAVYFASSTNTNVITKQTSLPEVDGYGVVDYTIRLANPRAEAVNYVLTDTIPVNAQYLSGSAWGGMNFDAAAGAVAYQGSFTAPEVDLTRYSPPRWYGYYPMALVGVDPFPLPDDPDEGGWLVGGLDFYYMGEHYNSGIWSINGTLEAGTESDRNTGFVNLPMPYQDAINNLLAPWWADIDLSAGGNWYLARIYDQWYDYIVLEWENVSEFGTGGEATATFQIWMIEGTDYVWFAYDHIDPAWYAGGTVGIENASGLAGDQYYISSPNLNIPPTGTPPDSSMDLWVEFTGTPPLEMGFSVLATGPAQSRILNEVVVRNNLGDTERAWAITKIQDWSGIWLPLIMK